MAYKNLQLKILSCAVILSAVFNICFSLMPLKEVSNLNFGVSMASDIVLYTYMPINLMIGSFTSETKINGAFKYNNPVSDKKSNDNSSQDIYGAGVLFPSSSASSDFKQKSVNNLYFFPGGDKRLCNMSQFYRSFTIQNNAYIMLWLIFLLMYLAVLHRDKWIIMNKNYIRIKGTPA